MEGQRQGRPRLHFGCGIFLMDEAIRQRTSVTPPVMVVASSSERSAMVVSQPSPKPQAGTNQGRKRGRSYKTLELLREQTAER